MLVLNPKLYTYSLCCWLVLRSYLSEVNILLVRHASQLLLGTNLLGPLLCKLVCSLIALQVSVTRNTVLRESGCHLLTVHLIFLIQELWG